MQSGICTQFKRPRRSPDTGAAPTWSFDLLGFTHFWGRSLKGKWVVKRKTAKARLKRALQRVSTWCRANWHQPIKQQHARLCQVLRGHDVYFGIAGNGRALASLHHHVTRIWYKWLARRCWRSRWTWTRMLRLLEALPLPPPRVVHSVYQA